jgi:hypothetical protein
MRRRRVPAIGQRSKTEYSEDDILIDALYRKMSSEVLLRFDGRQRPVIVTPVRRVGAPHFRAVAGTAFRRRIGRRENDPSHTRCIKFLTDRLLNKQLEVATRVFEGNAHTEQIIFASPPKAIYSWWTSAKDCRIVFDKGRYIIPDVCGRDPSAFFPGGKNRNIVIEVIRTHAPEQRTFAYLRELSKQNHVILFYFIAEDNISSGYNRYDDEDDHLFRLRIAFYLIDGAMWGNGAPLFERSTGAKDAWQKASDKFKFAIEGAAESWKRKKQKAVEAKK